MPDDYPFLGREPVEEITIRGDMASAAWSTGRVRERMGSDRWPDGVPPGGGSRTDAHSCDI